MKITKIQLAENKYFASIFFVITRTGRLELTPLKVPEFIHLLRLNYVYIRFVCRYNVLNKIVGIAVCLYSC